MEANQANTSPEITDIPQGIPTGVFVANNQTSTTVDVPVVEQAPVQVSVAQVVPAPVTEGPLDKVLKSLARFFAKIMGQPDPITGAPNPASQALQKWENIVGKVRGAANQVVSKATDVAGKAVDTVNQATEKIQQIVPPPAAPATTSQQPPVTPVVETAPVTPQQVQPTPQ